MTTTEKIAIELIADGGALTPLLVGALLNIIRNERERADKAEAVIVGIPQAQIRGLITLVRLYLNREGAATPNADEVELWLNFLPNTELAPIAQQEALL